MSAYTTYDFAETLKIVGIDPEQIEHVQLAWGVSHGSTDEPGTEWSGGFLMRMKAKPDGPGGFAFVWGWNDYTGWGCQDGAEVRFLDGPAQISELTKMANWKYEQPGKKGLADWDPDPADLNLWLERGAPDPYGL